MSLMWLNDEQGKLPASQPLLPAEFQNRAKQVLGCREGSEQLNLLKDIFKHNAQYEGMKL